MDDAERLFRADGLRLAPEEVGVVVHGTEGWFAGLRLASPAETVARNADGARILDQLGRHGLLTEGVLWP
jgi:ATP/maltotriose-dependent transcriptional regulator MalT